ncbi:Wall-associated receptor kinase-like [Thalictrum thalictroides]|uniref:Wall-associated receptor kinase-like n=1 Tax=Thalictrum thalictroides TaxID=46969 RepID=A0A7J6WYZ0_THATH|nr:Wall-associated receptor kinase-like [Thalictrum thalictroides]
MALAVSTLKARKANAAFSSSTCQNEVRGGTGSGGIEETVVQNHGFHTLFKALRLSSDSGGGWIALLATIISNLLFVLGALLKEKYDRKRDDQRKEEEEKRAKSEFFERNGGSQIQDRFLIFTVNDVKDLTNNYHPSLRLADEDTYRGTLVSNPVIVKKGIKVPKQNVQKFLSIMENLYEDRHRNIIRVIGGCFETCCPVIVYEFVGESLEKVIADLSWYSRFQLIRDIANGLWLLHVRKNIFHGALSPSTIFVDENNVGKICIMEFSTTLWDNGLYADIHKNGKAADVYRFGMIVSHLITGISPNSQSPTYKDLLKMKVDDFIAEIDKVPGLVRASVGSIWNMLELGIRCSDEKQHLRPVVETILEKVERIVREFERIPRSRL